MRLQSSKSVGTETKTIQENTTHGCELRVRCRIARDIAILRIPIVINVPDTGTKRLSRQRSGYLKQLLQNTLRSEDLGRTNEKHHGTALEKEIQKKKKERDKRRPLMNT